jgi:hypothetical protein
MGNVSAAVAVFALMLTTGAANASAAPTPPTIKHVWVITLENESADVTFGPKSPAHYFNNTLRTQGVFLDQYYATGHASLDNYISMVSGQGANVITQADCVFYMNVVPGVLVNGQAAGEGCVYPKSVKTIADQMAARGLSWKGYMQDMGNTPSREAATCGHPALNSADGTQKATKQDNYATRHDPFMYFHSIIDSPTCTTNVVSLKPLADDLKSAATTPAFSFITPSLCEDGHDAPCADGRPGGLVSADLFLSTWVPRILASPAYHEGGMVIVNFDESETSDSSSCCGQQPNLLGSPLDGETGTGGGRTGAVVVSSLTKPGTTSEAQYNHYSLLRSIEDVFGLDHLGFAAAAGLNPFGPDVYSAPEGVASPVALAAGASAVAPGSSSGATPGSSSSASSTTTVPQSATHVLGKTLARTGGVGPLLGLVVLAAAIAVSRRRRVAQ